VFILFSLLERARYTKYTDLPYLLWKPLFVLPYPFLGIPPVFIPSVYRRLVTSKALSEKLKNLLKKNRIKTVNRKQQSYSQYLKYTISRICVYYFTVLSCYLHSGIPTLFVVETSLCLTVPLSWDTPCIYTVSLQTSCDLVYFYRQLKASCNYWCIKSNATSHDFFS
jgi:hypothetical protein